jgi:AraC-like DNA-binding protein
MLASRRPLSEVAALVGFSGPAAFSRWFKQTFDCSPSEWREIPENRRPQYRKRRGRAAA